MVVVVVVVLVRQVLVVLVGQVLVVLVRQVAGEHWTELAQLRGELHQLAYVAEAAAVVRRRRYPRLVGELEARRQSCHAEQLVAEVFRSVYPYLHSPGRGPCGTAGLCYCPRPSSLGVALAW